MELVRVVRLMRVGQGRSRQRADGLRMVNSYLETFSDGYPAYEESRGESMRVESHWPSRSTFYLSKFTDRTSDTPVGKTPAGTSGS